MSLFVLIASTMFLTACPDGGSDSNYYLQNGQCIDGNTGQIVNYQACNNAQQYGNTQYRCMDRYSNQVVDNQRCIDAQFNQQYNQQQYKCVDQQNREVQLNQCQYNNYNNTYNNNSNTSWDGYRCVINGVPDYNNIYNQQTCPVNQYNNNTYNQQQCGYVNNIWQCQ